MNWRFIRRNLDIHTGSTVAAWVSAPADELMIAEFDFPATTGKIYTDVVTADFVGLLDGDTEWLVIDGSPDESGLGATGIIKKPKTWDGHSTGKKFYQAIADPGVGGSNLTTEQKDALKTGILVSDLEWDSIVDTAIAAGFQISPLAKTSE